MSASTALAAQPRKLNEVKVRRQVELFLREFPAAALLGDVLG